MLLALFVRNVVLIDRLQLGFRPGLSVLTGETGAGKSILLDALGLAVGQRADSALVRHGSEQATVGAEFVLPTEHPVRALLALEGLPSDGNVLLRRQLAADGRSRAFINDQPVSVGLLRRVGDLLVEIEGQFEEHRLLRAASHGPLLDAFGGLGREAAELARRWRGWRDAEGARAAAEEEAARARRDEDYLRYAVDELAAFRPQPGEENALAERRALLRRHEAIGEAVAGALADIEGERGLPALAAAGRRLGRVAGLPAERIGLAMAALDRASAEAAEAAALLRGLAAGLDADAGRLAEIEDRLFALRDLARKHSTPADELPALYARLAAELAAIEDRGTRAASLHAEEMRARAAYLAAGERLARARAEAAGRLDAAVNAELPSLKLEQARFQTRVQRLEESQWGESGIERVVFEAATAPGAPAGPLARIASGGELARFMLALKVALAEAEPVPTLVFDEVDSAVGGATAAAVGERLARLARGVQVLVVTHSPQVAALGAHHWRVAKADGTTEAEELPTEGRREEIARMLSGAVVTDEARRAAERLMEAGAG